MVQLHREIHPGLLAFDTVRPRLLELDLECLQGFEHLVHHCHGRFVAGAVHVERTLVHRERGRSCLLVERRARAFCCVLHRLASKVLVELERLLIFTLRPVLARLSRGGP